MTGMGTIRLSETFPRGELELRGQPQNHETRGRPELMEASSGAAAVTQKTSLGPRRHARGEAEGGGVRLTVMRTSVKEVTSHQRR